MRVKWMVQGFLGLALTVGLQAGEKDREIAQVYLEQAYAVSDEDTSRLFVEKALQFNPQSSDALYLKALLMREDQKVERSALFHQAMELNNWTITPKTRAMASYMSILVESRQWDAILREIPSLSSAIESNADLLYPYTMALDAKGEKGKLEDALEVARLLYLDDSRFWGFFLEEESFFLPFFDYLKRIEYFPSEIVNLFLAHLPKGEAERQAVLWMLKDKGEEGSLLDIYLSLNGLISQEEALIFLMEKGNIWDLRLHRQFYESLEDPLLREEYENWVSSLSGTFYWMSDNSRERDNEIILQDGSLINWSYLNAQGQMSTITFKDSQPSVYNYQGEILVHYSLYPMVDFILDKKGEEERLYTLGAGLLSIPLVESIFFTSLGLPLFLPLDITLIPPQLNESLWMEDLVKLQVLQGDNLVSETDYLRGQILRKRYFNPLTYRVDRYDFYEKGVLTFSQRDVNLDGYFEVLVVYMPEKNGFYTLLDMNRNGETDFLYYQDGENILEYWDWFDEGKIDYLFIKDSLKGNQGRLIPLDSQEAIPWRNFPKFQVRDI